MPKPIQTGKRTRMTYSQIDEICEMPNLIKNQIDSYEWFKREGVKEVFEEISPIKDYTGNHMLEFSDYHFEDFTKYNQDECKEKEKTYEAALKVKTRLINKETGEIIPQEISLGMFPMMTENGTFIYNGAERVVVSQLVRSPSSYYYVTYNKYNKALFSGEIIPNRGAWIEFETGKIENIIVKLDRKNKFPLTTFLRALGFGTNEEIFETFGEDYRILQTLQKDATADYETAIKEVYKKLRPGEPPSVEKAQETLKNLLFNPKRYDLAKVGRMKFNKKLGLVDRITNAIAMEDVIDPNTGEFLIEKGNLIDKALASQIENAGVKSLLVMSKDGEENETRVIGNNFVDLAPYVDEDISGLDLPKRVFYPILMEIVSNSKSIDDLKEQLVKNKSELCPKYLLIDDLVASVSYLLNLANGIGRTDEKDHFGNRRLKSVGELLQNQFRTGLVRMEKQIKEMLSVEDRGIAPKKLIFSYPLTSVIKEFFGSSQLSQFMDQTNPLAELTNKRRLSALGPGGVSRERASVEVRDVHHSHYGRMCPIETPEGQNIGLIGCLTTHAVVDEYGFIKTPYRVVDKENNRVTNEIHYLAADEEEPMIIAQANEPLDSEGHFINLKIAARGVGGEILLVPRAQVDYIDVSPKQLVSVAAAMIPFLENDDANRALMGSNMQRQAVPLLVSEAPMVGTGMESRAARDSGVTVQARNAGVVEYVDGQKIVIKRNDNGEIDQYNLLKFKRSNQSTCVNQKPIVYKGENVEKGEIIADGSATDMGEIALGKNLLVGFMAWEGYNYEDAIILNEKLVMQDTLTSLHIEKYETKALQTKLGSEEITSEIVDISEDKLKNLDQDGIIRIGAEVEAENILVGKVTPKAPTTFESEHNLLFRIFENKALDSRNTSLKVPHGQSGIVVDVKSFSRENGDELDANVHKIVRCSVASKKKINVGDKMAGRHGNKGVISLILPESDMPFMENGEALQVLLNPLGVPSRMNVGQVLEVHLGLAAKEKGWHIVTPVFDGASEKDIIDILDETGYPKTGKLTLKDGRTGEKFDNPVTVGYMYMLKLHHLVDDKIHARSVGPYSLVTQQPLGGKAQFGGQRFGEMEVWALEAYGAAHTLQELLTVKSDDIVGRDKAFESIVKGKNINQSGMPDSFKVLIKEMQSLALDVKVLTHDDSEITIDYPLDMENAIVSPEEARRNIDNERKLEEEGVLIVQHYEEKPEEDDLENEYDDENGLSSIFDKDVLDDDDFFIDSFEE